MGQVGTATHTVTGRSLALKFLLASAADEPELRRRFLCEAKAATAVEHPNVIEVRDSFELEDGTPLIGDGNAAVHVPRAGDGRECLDHRADVWAIGVISFECLTGRRPVEAETYGQIIRELIVRAA